MRQLMYSVILFVFLGCSNNSYKNMEATEVSNDDIVIDSYEEEMSFAALEDSYTILVSEKLQDYLDKQLLIQEHPEFKTVTDSIHLFALNNRKQIEQIKFLNRPEKLSDTITKLITEVHFGNTEIDTVISYITTSSTLIDGVQFRTSKVTFDRLKTSSKNR
ncbi:hypothetical protein [Aquimarina litoralis]|uniref:hypothetical protein n=1 Tax=Aquimarina litoralis TaxID=584605 RepID=UPI001C586937|nr:hypothetical protein [Aquimarina litoralis]MBW1297275.1 hypothetical protein [Aquimarina litoralis]